MLPESSFDSGIKSHRINVDDLVDLQHDLIIASSTDQMKRIVQKTIIVKNGPGQYSVQNTLHVMRLGKIIMSTIHITEAIKMYNKI